MSSIEMSKKSRNIPVIESDVFVRDVDNRFAVGVTAVNGSVVNGLEREFAGAAALRANIYVEKGFVSPGELDEYGTELDRDDERSVHFVVLERLAQDSLARVVGNMRLIVKSDDEPLPVEKMRPDAFLGQAGKEGSTEVSRLICQHEDAYVQGYLKWPLFIAGLKYVNRNNLGPVYGLLDPRLTKMLGRQGVPAVALADEVYIPEINASKQPVQIDTLRLGRHINQVGDDGIDDTEFSYISLENAGNDRTVVGKGA